MRGYSVPCGILDESSFFRLEVRPTATPRFKPRSDEA
jgi:hypothetical protein